MRSPRDPLNWNAATAMPTPTRAARRVLRSLSDRPVVITGGSFLKFRDGRFLGRRNCGHFCGRAPQRGDQVTAPDHDFMYGSLHSVAIRGELALLDGALDEDVVALLEGRRDAGKIAVKR